MYRDGRGVLLDPAQAMIMLKEAAYLGFAKAQFEMALHYDEAHAADKNAVIAIDWYLKAAQNGHKDTLAKLKELGLEK